MEGERETILTALEFIKTGSPSLNIDLNGGGWGGKSMNFADLSKKFHRNRNGYKRLKSYCDTYQKERIDKFIQFDTTKISILYIRYLEPDFKTLRYFKRCKSCNPLIVFKIFNYLQLIFRIFQLNYKYRYIFN